ncbi:gamma-glutamyltransferase [Streptomyces sp. NPDC002896]|uniref:gamma-glutamyltransferase n=1 Tax=Streptomyces sp. NPDC002896 TaxID=3154438 RepID=UPI00332EADBE
MTAAPLRVAVAAPHPTAVEAAGHAVAAGGGAVEAAVAAAVALAVVYPHQCSLGGDLVALVRSPDGQVRAVLSAGAAGSGADPERLRRASGERMPAQGPHTVTVPGAMAGWAELARLGGRFGSLSAALRYAAGQAAEGTRVSAGLARAITAREDAIRADAGLRALLTRDGVPMAEGDQLRQPRLAATLHSLADDPRSFYQGLVADTLAAAVEPLTSADFAAHRAEIGTPLTLSAPDGTHWWAAPPPFQGATALALLAEPPSVRTVRAAVARRDELLGDPRRALVDVDGMLHPDDGALAPAGPPGRAAGDTVAVTAVDSEGWAVSLIQSVYQWFGSGICEPETGIVLHNRGSAFSLEPGHPALLGPGLRPPHTLCPLLGLAEGGMLLAVGCQGGRAQPQILAQTAPALSAPDADPADVVARPRWVIGARDLGFEQETLLAEPGARPGELPGDLPLARTAGPEDDCGHVQTARLHPDGRLDAAADPRADGHSAVFTGTHPVRGPVHTS